MLRSLKRYFLINPQKGQVRLNEHERLQMRVVRTKNKNKRLRMKRLKMNLDVAKALGQKNLLVQIF